MYKNNGALQQDETPDKILNLLYTTGFRLTGNHQSAALLVHKALSTFEEREHSSCEKMSSNNERSELTEAVRSVYLAFIEDNTAGSRQQPKTFAYGSNGPTCKNNRVQEALLNLKPGERTAVVLRDTLGLTYAEIARVTMSSEKDVAERIASARWTLRKLLTPAAV